LTLNEFSILNASEVDGLMKYGGSGEFKVHMSLEGTNIVWTVTTDNARQIEVWGIYLGEKAVGLMREMSLQNIDTSSGIAMQAIASLSQKLEFAQKNPIWSEVKVAGAVVQQGTNWAIQTGDGALSVVGTNPNAVSSWAGRRVVADGFAKVPGQFELLRLIEQRTNTLELFVMSLCPYGQRAETTIYNFLEQSKVNSKPNVELRYLFYKQKKDGRETFGSLHGEEEIAEDLVQIVIRDRFPSLLSPYVRLRAISGKLPWQKLAEKVGLPKTDISEIENAITTQRDSLIQNEYDYATGHYEIYDGSPTYVWESERVTDLSKIDAFKELTGSTQEICAK
jgi:hypothetical protein